MYSLGQIQPAQPEIAALAWDRLNRGDLWGTIAYETLDTYVAHAPHSESIPRLLNIAASAEQIETLRYHAVRLLSRERQVDRGLLRMHADGTRTRHQKPPNCSSIARECSIADDTRRTVSSR